MRQRYPEPPRSVPQATAATPRAEDAYNPDKPSAGQTARQPAAKDAPQAGTPVNEVDSVQQQRGEAKQFIRPSDNQFTAFSMFALSAHVSEADLQEAAQVFNDEAQALLCLATSSLPNGGHPAGVPEHC